uniref:Uncharacterized protein n=1 Tax=Anguilla anguilla TaxID=7936 RepID=A0A0E9UDA2_ANGAN
MLLFWGGIKGVITVVMVMLYGGGYQPIQFHCWHPLLLWRRIIYNLPL